MKKEYFDYLTDVYPFQKSTGTFTIPVVFDHYDNLFKRIDDSPIRRKDLTNELTSFLIESANEIPTDYTLAIAVHILKELADPNQENNVIKGIHNYFSYLAHQTLQEMANKKRRAIKYVFFSVLFITTTVMIRSFIQPGMLMNIILEGLTIGGWVFLWEAFSIYVINMDDANTDIRDAKRLCQSPVYFSYGNDRE